MATLKPIIKLNFEDDVGTVCKNTGVGGDGYYSNGEAWARTPLSGTFASTGNCALVPKIGAVGGIKFTDTGINSQHWTIGAWFKYRSTAFDSVFFCNAQVADENGFSATINSTNINVAMWFNEQSFSSNIILNHTFTANEISCFAVSCEIIGADTHVKFYINKEYIGTVVKSGLTYKVPTLGELSIGGRQTFSTVEDVGIRNLDAIDRVFFYDRILDLDEIIDVLYAYASKESIVNSSCQIVADAEIVAKSRPSTFVEIVSEANAFGLSRSKSETTVSISSDASKDYSFVYRTEKGSALTDSEIDNNFNASNPSSTYTPVFNGGFITNHVQGCIYFGDLIVNDADGSYTGTGYCWAKLEGYTVGKRGVAS